MLGRADTSIPLVALLDQAIELHRLQLGQVTPQRRPGRIGRDAVIVVGPARGSGTVSSGQPIRFQAAAVSLSPVAASTLRGVSPQGVGAHALGLAAAEIRGSL